MTSIFAPKRRRYVPEACSKPHFIPHNQLRQHESNVESTVRHVGSHLLEFEFLRELLVELLQLSDELTAGLDDCGFGCDLAVGVDAELEGRKERVRDLVGSEGDVIHAVELVAEHVGEGVVFLVESEESGICDLCKSVLDHLVFVAIRKWSELTGHRLHLNLALAISEEEQLVPVDLINLWPYTCHTPSDARIQGS